jgi:hypothetical protein
MPSFVRPFLSAALIVAFASCHEVTALDEATAPYTVVEAQNLWQSQSISTYSYVATHQCFCVFPPGPVMVEVTQGQVSRVIVQATGVEISTNGWYTIDQLFDQLLSTTPPDTVVFDARLGYPRKIERCCVANDSGSIYTASTLGRLG